MEEEQRMGENFLGNLGKLTDLTKNVSQDSHTTQQSHSSSIFNESTNIAQSDSILANKKGVNIDANNLKNLMSSHKKHKKNKIKTRKRKKIKQAKQKIQIKTTKKINFIHYY